MRSYLPIVLSLLVSSTTQAQPVRVQLDVDDARTGGIVKGTIAAALRSTGDVIIVNGDERPDYRVRALVMCAPDMKDCDTSTSYIGFFEIVEAPTLGDARVLAELGLPADKKATVQQVERMYNYIDAYGIPRMTWTFQYGRQAYEQAFRELVRRIDTSCFERIRIRRRNPSLSYGELMRRWEAAGANCSGSN